MCVSKFPIRPSICADIGALLAFQHIDSATLLSDLALSFVLHIHSPTYGSQPFHPNRDRHSHSEIDLYPAEN